mmetsp:Transcript_31939/g.48848  ORF Transcript_31939/g.48848 Transcript_31939/m.48848 type:complete len:204 (-) Transcript_31939:585-1196(-)
MLLSRFSAKNLKLFRGQSPYTSIEDFRLEEAPPPLFGRKLPASDFAALNAQLAGIRIPVPNIGGRESGINYWVTGISFSLGYINSITSQTTKVSDSVHLVRFTIGWANIAGQANARYEGPFFGLPRGSFRIYATAALTQVQLDFRFDSSPSTFATGPPRMVSTSCNANVNLDVRFDGGIVASLLDTFRSRFVPDWQRDLAQGN